jgi:hypothetical protein
VVWEDGGGDPASYPITEANPISTGKLLFMRSHDAFLLFKKELFFEHLDKLARDRFEHALSSIRDGL